MQDFTVILMLKKDDVIEREISTVKIARHGELLRNMYVTEDDGLTARMFVQAPGELKDWEFQAVYDYYDTEIYEGLGLTVTETPGDDNPVWEIAFPYIEAPERLADKVLGILNLHKRELDGVMEAIKEAEDEYHDV